MLHVDPNQRLTATGILQHPWVHDRTLSTNPLPRAGVSKLKTTVTATLRAMTQAVPVVELKSIGISSLASRSVLALSYSGMLTRRRRKGKEGLKPLAMPA